MSLSRSQVLYGLQCPRRLWLHARDPRGARPPVDPLSPASQVHAAARALYPDGVEVPHGSPWEDAVAATAHALAQGARVLFRPALQAAGVRVRPDILVREDEGWAVLRVKASLRVKPINLDELALEVFALRALGWTVRSAGVIRLNRRYRRDGQHPLLVRMERMGELSVRLAALDGQLESMRAHLTAAQEPDVAPGRQCVVPRPCAYRAHCSPTEPVPATGTVRYGEGLWPVLDQPGPHYFLDFEAVAPPIPLWTALRPFQSVPVQISVHRLDGALTHRDFLHASDADPRPAVADALLELCGDTGPIYVYSDFESRTIGALAQRLPDVRARLHALRARLVDLLPVLRQNLDHPGIVSSWSIKRVLPVLSPGDHYDDLEINDGGVAARAWLRMRAPGTSAAEAQRIAADLRRYCAQDTLALVRIRQALLDARP